MYLNSTVKRAMVSSFLDLHDEEDPEERKFNQDISKWEQKLREFFGKTAFYIVFVESCRTQNSLLLIKNFNHFTNKEF